MLYCVVGNFSANFLQGWKINQQILHKVLKYWLDHHLKQFMKQKEDILADPRMKSFTDSPLKIQMKRTVMCLYIFALCLLVVTSSSHTGSNSKFEAKCCYTHASCLLASNALVLSSST